MSQKRPFNCKKKRLVPEINGKNPGYYANKAHQCAKCATQYQGENFDYIQHRENCNHTTTVLMCSAQLLLQELSGNSPTTVKDDSESKTNLEERTQERRQRFNINNANFYRLQKNLHKYKHKRAIDKLQKNKIERQVQYEISESQREFEELQRRIHKMLMMHGLKLNYRMGCLILSIWMVTYIILWD